jgi:hypothetical protein
MQHNPYTSPVLSQSNQNPTPIMEHDDFQDQQIGIGMSIGIAPVNQALLDSNQIPTPNTFDQGWCLSFDSH